MDPTPVPFDPEILPSLVSRALDRPAAQVLRYECSPIKGGWEYGSSLYLVSGQAVVGRETRSWKLVYKRLVPHERRIDPQGAWYWKREALAYQSGMLQRLPGGLSAPHCLQVSVQPDTAHIWMEYVEDDKTGWTLETFARAARILGEFNGVYLSGTPLPSQPWIPRSMLRRYVENAAPGIQFIREQPNHPFIKATLGPLLGTLLPLWDARKRLLDFLDHFPPVFCHQDAFRSNLFMRGGRLIAIDWTYMGPAPAGAELAAFVGVSILDCGSPYGSQALEEAALEGYAQGLSAAGCRTHLPTLRHVFAVTAALRYGLGAAVGELFYDFQHPDLSRQRVEKGGEMDENTRSALEERRQYLASLFKEALQEEV